MTAKHISHILAKTYDHHRYRYHNMYVFDWESDFLSVTGANYVWEIEIKISKSDFMADFKKPKHKQLPIPLKKEKGLPNKFFFCAPKGIIDVKDIPDYAGFMEVNKWGVVDVIKTAPMIHKNIIDIKKKTYNKMYYRYQDSVEKTLRDNFAKTFKY